MRRDRDPQRRPASSSRAVSASKFRSHSRFDLEHRRRPAVLARLDELVIPVGALDQPDLSAAASAARPPAQSITLLELLAASRAGRPGARCRPTGPSANSSSASSSSTRLEDGLARVERLHVDVQVGPASARLAQQRPQPCGGVALPELGRVGPQQRRQRRDLHARRWRAAAGRPVGSSSSPRRPAPRSRWRAARAPPAQRAA